MTTTNTSRISRQIAGVASTLALATLGFCGAAQARDNLAASVGIVLPVVQVGNMNAYPVYNQAQPVYVQPQPVYVQPAPVYAPRSVYYGQPVYEAPQPIYYARPHHRRHGGYYVQAPGYGYGHGRRPGYAPIYYRR